ncbi:MAG: serine protein kinase RIO [Candidatus Thermoplasmatota archaeon]|nr:serine protein kinase RIO [Candidatus Thermoplasmatota archaeon]
MAKKDVFDIVNEKFDKRIKRETLIIDAERFKTYDEVFDQQNLDNIYRLMRRGRITTVECPVSTGKEANVYKANTDEGLAAVKIFRTSTSTFGNFLQYIDGDRRFQKIDRSKRGIIYTWARKEYVNLETMHEAGLSVPEPRALFRNILIMDYVQYEGKPAPQIKFLDAELDEWEEMWRSTLEFVKRIFMDCELVHADLSEYNILYTGELVFIDVGQSVHKEHPMAKELLKRDMKVISTFFEKKGIKSAKEEAEALREELMSSFAEDEEKTL